MRLLLIEDDPLLSSAFKQVLDTAGFDVELGSSAAPAAPEKSLAHFPVVMIGARTRPVERARHVRHLLESRKAVPLVLLGAPRAGGRAASSRRHLVQEFQLEALVACLQAVLDRKASSARPVLRFGNVAVDGDGQVVVGRKPVHFHPAEVALLSLLIRRRGRIVSKKSIEARLYGKADAMTANAVEVQVHRLRKSLAAAAANVRVRTMRNAGYFISCDAAAA